VSTPASEIVVPRRSSSIRDVSIQATHAARGLLGSVIAVIFSFGMPIAWLVLIGFVAGNAVVDPTTGVRVMQYATPSAVAMGAFFATLPSVAVAVGEAKERLVLKRLRSTPMPGWAFVAGQVAAAAVFGAVSVAVTMLLALTVYGVRLPAASVAPFVLNVTVALLAYCSLGMAVASLTRSARLAEVISIGSAVVLAFISGVFVIGDGLPAWLDAVARVLPLEPFVTALQVQFDPSGSGVPWALPQLAVVAAWGIAGAITATATFRWVPTARPRRGRDTESRVSTAARTGAGHAMSHMARSGVESNRVTEASIVRTRNGRRVAAHAALALRTTLHRPGDLFFSIAVPVGLFLLLMAIGAAEREDGIPAVTFTAASMATWGIAVVAYMNTAEGFARSRERGVLKRLASTPTGMGELVIGRGASSCALAVVVAGVLVATGALTFGLRPTAWGLLLSVVVVVVGAASLVACAHLLVAAVRSTRAIGAIALLSLFVLAFFSEVFLADPPEWMKAVGAVFPLAHLQHGLTATWLPNSPAVPWLDLLVLVAWTLGAGAAAVALSRARMISRS
jgi:ABC-2 type transport system permease protein